MEKRTLFIIGGLGVFLVLIVGGVFLVRNTGEKVGTSTGTPSFFSGLFGDDNIVDTMFSFMTEDEDGETAGQDNMRQGEKPLLRQLYPSPVSGAVFIELERTDNEGNIVSIPGVRVMERSSGNILDIPLDGSDIWRISNTTIPAVEEVYWSDDYMSLLLRRFDMEEHVVKNTYVHLSEGTTDVTGTPEDESLGTLVATTSIQDVLGVALSPDRKKVFTLIQTQSGSKGYISSITGEGTPKEIFSSPLREWLVEWVRNDNLYLSTKPSMDVPGYAYTASVTGNGTMKKIIGGIPGLMTHMSPVENVGIFTTASDSSFSLSLLTASGTSDVGFDTLPEKCAWTQNAGKIYCGVPIYVENASYPDDWYKGIRSFTDAIWYADITTGETTMVAEAGAYDTPPLDVIHPSIDSTETYMLFINKNDLTPWLLTLK